LLTKSPEGTGPNATADMQPVKLPCTVPVVLSMQEAAALIAAARNIKHQAALSVAYGEGLRASEVLQAIEGESYRLKEAKARAELKAAQRRTARPKAGKS
jgi:site-specific recombinase XerC